MLKIVLILIINLLKYSDQSSCSLPSDLGIARVATNIEIGSPIYNYTMFQTADILSTDVLSPNDIYFAFNVSTLQLISKIVLDGKITSNYNLRLFMTCSDVTAKIFEQIINIISLNNNQVSWIFPNSINYFNGQISDNSPNNTIVNFDVSPKFNYTSSPGTFELILIDETFYAIISGTTAIIRNKKLLNYDIQNGYTLTLVLQYTDQTAGTLTLPANATVLITVIKSNNKPPFFEMSSYKFQTFTNATKNSVFQVFPQPLKAYDGNLAINSTIIYKFATPIDFLYLDPLNGILSSNVSTLFASYFQTTIIAYNSKNISLQAYVVVNISIINVPVQFYQKFQSENLQENINFVDIQLNFTSDKSKIVSFQMVPEVGNFQIASNGHVYLKNPLNFNIQNIFNFTITASDDISSDQMILVINVLKVLTYNPKFLMSPYYFYGDISSGKFNVTLSIINYNPNSTIKFDLTDNYGVFKINPDSSNCYLYVATDKVQSIRATVYSLIVNFTHSALPQVSDSVQVIVDFSTTISTTTVNSRIKDEILIICILLPILFLFLLIFPILLCYYKKRPCGESYCPPSGRANQSSLFGEFTGSKIFDESNFQIYDLYSGDGLVRQLQQEIKLRTFIPREESRKNITSRKYEIDSNEIKEVTVPKDENVLCNDTDMLSDKYTDLKVTL